jgi:rubredoxin
MSLSSMKSWHNELMGSASNSARAGLEGHLGSTEIMARPTSSVTRKYRRRLWRTLPPTLQAFVTTIGVLVLVVVLLLFLPVILPVVGVSLRNERKRLEKAADDSRCPVCGTILGTSALRLADEEWSEYVRRLHREHPGTKFRLVRTLDAICPQCGQRFSFRKKERAFVPLDPVAT